MNSYPLLNENCMKLLPILPNINPSEKYRSSIPSITTGSKLGAGGYGTVLKCIDKAGRELAVKKICRDDSGITCLMEASIMSTIEHPNINRAYEIHYDLDTLYIIQELAISDLKVYRSLHDPSCNQIIKWIYEILCGLDCLHSKGIIHGDIKATNILIYDNLSVKLSDFTLSTKDNWINTYTACTSTHRPLEVWINIGDWNKSIDIWSLGCTIFEIVYGHGLFPSQEAKSSINAIIDWSNHDLVKSTTHLSLRDVPHHSYILPSSFECDDSLKGQLNKLIISLLKIDHRDRPTVSDLLKHSIFSSLRQNDMPMKIDKPKIKIPKLFSLSKQKQTYFRDFITKSIQNEVIIEHSLYLCSQLKKLGNIGDELKSQTCMWISYKLICKKALPQNKLTVPYHRILETERIICHHLGYKLHKDD
jgi:serine/threonine protein kinase